MRDFSTQYYMEKNIPIKQDKYFPCFFSERKISTRKMKAKMASQGKNPLLRQLAQCQANIDITIENFTVAIQHVEKQRKVVQKCLSFWKQKQYSFKKILKSITIQRQPKLPISHCFKPRSTDCFLQDLINGVFEVEVWKENFRL